MASFVHGRLRLRIAHVRVSLFAALLAAAALAWILAAGPGSQSAGAPLPTTTATPAPANLSRQIAALAASHPGQTVSVIVQFDRGVTPARRRALVRSVGGRPGVGLTIINALSARLTAAASRRLAANPMVHAVTLNSVIKQTSWSGPSGPPSWALSTSFDQSVGATRLWRRSTGAGVGVAVIDTGISGDLADFRTSRSDDTSRVIASAVIDPNATTADDTYGHGTAVAGLIAGNGAYRDSDDSLWGQYDGTAPDANLISVKVADDDGQATILDAIYGLQFAVDHKAQDNIGVINMSFRSTTAQSYQTDPLDAAAEQAWNDGIVVVAAAGNLGTAPDAVDYAPANDPYVITVGAVDDQGTRNTSDDVIPSWSSQGTTQDGFAKPDVLAPGAHIVTTLAPGSDFSTLCPTCIINNDYFQVSGTSLAAPVVSGIAADLVAAHPDWTPDMIKGAIVNTATSLPNGGNEVDAMAAYWADGSDLVANQGLSPNTLIDPDTGDINYNAASWSAASWSSAVDPLAASWSAASWSCESCSADSSGDGSAGGDSSGGVDPTSASWSSVGWTTMWG
jgi:serine protease AprX